MVDIFIYYFCKTSFVVMMKYQPRILCDLFLSMPLFICSWDVRYDLEKGFNVKQNESNFNIVIKSFKHTIEYKCMSIVVFLLHVNLVNVIKNNRPPL